MRALAFATALSLVALASSPARATTYTLDQLLERAKGNWPGVAAAREALAGAQHQLSEANYLWAPTGEFTFGITGSPHVRCADATGYSDPNHEVRESNCIQTNAVTVTRATNFVDVLPIHGVALALSAKVTQPLYTFGKIEAARNAAKAGVKIAEDQVEAARAEVMLNVVRAYWGLKWSRAAEQTLNDGRGRVKGWVDKIEHDLERGKGSWTETDLLRLKLAFDQIELALLEVHRAVEIAQAAVRVLSDDAEADIDPEEITTSEIIEKPRPYYEAAARTHRPEARMLDSAVGAMHSFRKLRIAQFLPDVALVTSVGYSYAQDVDDPKNAFMNHPNGASAGMYLGLRLPIDIAGNLARYRRAGADMRNIEARRREALGGIALEIDRAYADAVEARHRYEKTAHGEKIARGWYNAVDQNIQIGTAAAHEVVDAARAYFEMRLGHLRAIMDVNVTLAVLQRTAGVL
jgi:outer membrane protein TolC